MRGINTEGEGSESDDFEFGTKSLLRCGGVVTVLETIALVIVKVKVEVQRHDRKSGGRAMESNVAIDGRGLTITQSKNYVRRVLILAAIVLCRCRGNDAKCQRLITFRPTSKPNYSFTPCSKPNYSKYPSRSSAGKSPLSPTLPYLKVMALLL